MTAYEDSIEVTGKGDVAAESGLSVAVEVTGKGAVAVEPGGLLLQDLIEFTGTGHIFAGPYIDWSYRRGVKITNYTGSGLTNYPVEVVLTSGNFDYGKCRTDGGDIRFSCGNLALSYWIEDWNYNGTSRIWVKASSIPEGFEVCLHIHYGKLDEVSESNGVNVWNVIVDEFSGDTLDPTKWEAFGTPTGSLTITVQDGYVKIHSSSYNSKQVGLKSVNDTLLGTNFRLLTRQKTTRDWTPAYAHQYSGQAADYNNMNGVHFAEYYSGHCPANCHIYHKSVISGSASNPYYQNYDLDWHRYLLKKLGTTHFKGIQDDESELTNTTNIYASDAPFKFFTRHDDYYTTVHDLYMDFIAITDKYASPDPIASLVPEEEEKALNTMFALHQSAEIEGGGAASLSLGLQPVLEIGGAGVISVVSGAATYHDSLGFTGAGKFLAPHVYIFTDIDNFLVENWSVSKTIQDVLWKFTGAIDKLVVPSYFINFIVFAKDHLDVEHTIFLGFIPGADYTRATAADKATLNAYDFGWYLSSQFVPESIRITPKGANPADTIKTLLGGEDWMSTTGIEPWQIRTVSDWATTKKPFIWNSKTSKWKAIKEICDYTHHVFVVKWRKTVNNEYYSAAYFVHEDDALLDTLLDLPPMETIYYPDPYLMSDVKINDKQEAKYNRVIVKGANKITGDWYSKTVESPGVTNGDELPIEYVYESTDMDSQAKTDAKAVELYNFFHTIARIYTASFKKRMDLELYQKIKFIGYDKIEEVEMRITAITYRRRVAEDIVEIQFTPEQKLADLRKLMRSMGADFMTEQQRIKEDFFIDLTEIAVGTVTEIDGNEAIVQLEKDEGLVKARIIDT